MIVITHADYIINSIFFFIWSNTLNDYINQEY